ncbi:MAG: CHRD domain-containing protein [Planctomycetaceae bacterium]
MKRTVWAVAARLAAATMMLAATAGSAMADWTWVSTFGPQAAGATGTGSSTVFFNETAKTIRVQFSYAGLTGNPTIGHIHAASTSPPYAFSNPNPRVALGFGVTSGAPGWSSVTPGPSGSYDRTFDVSTLTSTPGWSSGFKTDHAGLTIDQLNAKFVEYMNTGKAYINIHTSTNSNGEIGGFFTVVTPEPGHWALLAGGFAITAGRAWRKKRTPQPAATEPAAG